MEYIILKGELYNSDSLAHHGVKGQRWGIIRKKPNRSGAGSKGSDDDSSTSKATVRSSKKKNPAEGLSDQELRARINRIQMEKQYKDLTKKEKSAGAKFVSEVLSNAGKQIATEYAKTYGKKAFDELLTKASSSIAKKASSSVAKKIADFIKP